MRIHCLFTLFSLSFAIAIAQESKVTLIFAGDAMQHTPQIYAAKTDSGYNYEPVFELVTSKIAQADIAGVNFETTLGGKPYSGYPLFSSPDDFAKALHQAGFDIFFNANNHALDTGQKGLEQTISFIKQLGAKQTGIFVSKDQRELYYPLMIIKNGIRIAFFNYTYGTNGLLATGTSIINLIDTLLIEKDIVSAGLLKPDIMIAVMHWGEEYNSLPSNAQKKIAQFLLRNNVRIIIGHHPHVIQPIEIIKVNDSITHTVFYSLGNFISNQRQPNTDGGMLAEIVLSKNTNEPGVDAEITIESIDYSLVWVHKYFDSGKPVFRLLPVGGDNEKTAIRCDLTPYEQYSLERFVNAANKTATSTF